LQPFGQIGIGTESLDVITDNRKDKTEQNMVKERSSLPILVSTDSLKTISELRDRRIRPTVLEVGRSKGRRYSRVIQRFPAKVSDGTVKRRSGFYYWWNTKEVLISKTLGTTKYKKVAALTEILMKECSRFYLIHCDVLNKHKSR
jgi:vacuolar-type H+-ATPase subunit F/Vma7